MQLTKEDGKDGTSVEIPESLHKATDSCIEKGKWYIGICKPTKERVIRSMLQRDSYEVCLASQVETKVYKSRNRREVERIILPGMVFVRTDAAKLYNILYSFPSIYRFLIDRASSDNQTRIYASVSDSEMEKLQYMLHNAPNPVSITTEHLEIGQQVEVLRGPLAGFQGSFTKIGRTSCIVIKVEIGSRHYAYTEIPLEDVKPV